MKRFSKYILIAVLLLSIPSYSASLLDTLIGKNKTCNYVDNGKYMPFSDLQSSFPIFGKLVNGGCVDVTQNVTNMFQTGFKVFLGIVSLLAVVRIAIAGIQYIFQEQSPGSKSKAKQALTQSVVALILAFSGWVILNTVNTKLTDVGFNLTTGPLADLIQKGAAGVKNIAPTEGECIAGTNCGAAGVTQGGGNGTTNGNNPPTQYPADMAAAQKMNAAAKELLGKKTCSIRPDDLNNGKLACAFIVNDIVNNALGKPIRGQADNINTYGISTPQMKADLDSSDKFFLVGSDVGQLQPGDIIISPTKGDEHGHVGVYVDTGKIVSNSTTNTEVRDDFTPSKWVNYYEGPSKKLETYIYRPRAQ